MQNGFIHFFAMSLLKFASETRASLPCMPSTNLLIVLVLTLIIFLNFLSYIQERYHWIKPVGIHVIIAVVDVNYGFDLSVP